MFFSFSPWIALVFVPACIILFAFVLAFFTKPKDE